MSDFIGHHCGLGLVRLKKPLEYYQDKYNSPLWGLDKLYLLMQKQHNRGQDGAGIATVQLNSLIGRPYLDRMRSVENNPWQSIFKEIHTQLRLLQQKKPDILNNIPELKTHFPWAGEVLLGHLRYGTFGDNSVANCHPVLRQNNWRSRTLLLAGNFNLTNVEELFQKLIFLGQHPQYKSDTETMLEKVGHFLDVAVEELFRKFKPNYPKERHLISQHIEQELDILPVLTDAAKTWDGGYALGGILGHGDAFAARDPWGIRPLCWYEDEEIIVFSSERAAVATVFNVPIADVQSVKPGNCIIIKANGEIRQKQFLQPADQITSCSFERIYFSRGNDPEIYAERKQLGRLLLPDILKQINYDLENTVFSYIPNTAKVAFLGLQDALERHLSSNLINQLSHQPALGSIHALLAIRPRIEEVILKDVKLRTFITDDSNRDNLVGHVYDINYGSIRPNIDRLVCLDDSIVRGTTLKRSILAILKRLSPKQILIISSAPQIRYPDCYGIDMAQIEQFIAFQAALALLKERNLWAIVEETYTRIKEAEKKQHLGQKNYVKAIYEPFQEREISDKIAFMLSPDGGVSILYQTVENLNNAIPNHKGVWYFTGDYPTPGGTEVANRAFMNFMEGKHRRAYD
ncbi:MAG: amidophosphoribosyltransferase [Bacteroidia bacterium]|nr:amidophosphoribosyltransferase [Bacteroidia bacterium]